MKQFKYKIALIPTNSWLTIYIGKDVKPIQNHFIGLKKDFSDCDGFFIRSEGGNHAIALESWDYGLLIHEVSHAIDAWFDEIGAEDGEFRAYWLQYICYITDFNYRNWIKKQKKRK